ncbi:ribonuclease H-like domain-containing protein, partial [Mycena epipterygia]
KVMKTIGIERFIAASSDDTGNTRGCRRIICEKAPTMLNLPDPNHHLSNTVKHIILIPYFKQPIKILRGAVKHFSHSKQSKGMLKQLRIQENIGRGLETIGKTRFASVAWSAISLRRNLNPIRTLVTNGQVEIKKYNSYFIKDTEKTLDFQMKLNQLISVTEGIAKAIQCLDAASCNPADVFLLWLAVTAHIRAARTGSMIPEAVCNEIRGIINYRWHQFFVTNPGHEAYLAAFYLNPSESAFATIRFLLITGRRICKLDDL